MSDNKTQTRGVGAGKGRGFTARPYYIVAARYSTHMHQSLGNRRRRGMSTRTQLHAELYSVKLFF
ncbi:unnamed protein product [Acanthoscelides obtectus]|uniref:Uncharacterized protein n=1 Tax=Acanthoscelides obtectus TaxID=200917 RepID=A0A9P0L7X8_ACAOB|nr:unnamed protein product [Acanthoscelides obtectus]CAK1675963.1 hypothetical protein AOBTE_LOCUS30516 [Acanthoscelides obtectus]